MNIAIDTETTGLLLPSPAPLSAQPYIIELCAIKFDNNGHIYATYLSKYKPPNKLDPKITRITGITNLDLEDCKPFKDSHEDIKDFFEGTQRLIAHNAPFDMGMLRNELLRISGAAYHDFPWPEKTYCTVERSTYLKGYRLKLDELYKLATGNDHEGAHRAEADVLACIDCYNWLRKQK